ncbi:hypothetical protein APHAL10511_003929 [Amanita phalloides]|nr:hypothetical protein APHAL10511_003929 [Amanita phalloides]
MNQGNDNSYCFNGNGDYYNNAGYYNGAPFQMQAPYLYGPQALLFLDMSATGMLQLPFRDASASRLPFGGVNVQGMRQVPFAEASLQGMSQGMSQGSFGHASSTQTQSTRKERRRYHPYKRNKPMGNSGKLPTPNKPVEDTHLWALEYVNRAMAPRIPTDGGSTAPQSSSRKSRKLGAPPVNMQPYTRDQDIPKPESYVTPKLALTNCSSSRRSTNKRIDTTLDRARRRIYQCLKYSDRYRLPFSHSQLQALNKPNLRTNSVFRYLMENSLFLFGYQWTDDKEEDKAMVGPGQQLRGAVPNRRLEDLKEGLEANREVTCDGIEGALLENFHGATQELCSVLKPTRAGPEAHHDWMASEPNPRVMRYQVKGSEELTREGSISKFTDEESGTALGPGQGILQRHPDGGADISTHVQSIYYKEYKAALMAGQWVEQDPGLGLEGPSSTNSKVPSIWTLVQRPVSLSGFSQVERLACPSI